MILYIDTVSCKIESLYSSDMRISTVIPYD
jgi:hypothetical protein